MGHALSAPSVASESAGQLAAVGSRKDGGSKIPDRFQSLSHDGRRTEQDAVRKSQFFQNFGLIRLHHVVASDINIAAVLDSSLDFLGDLFRISIGAYIWNDHRFFLIWIDYRTPFLIGVIHKVDLFIDHRSMSGTDHGNVQFSYSGKGLQHIWLKWPYDTVEIIFRSPHISLMVCNLAGQNIMKTVMRTKGIAGHKDLFLLDIGIHSIRPVKIRHYQEPQSLSADFHCLIVFYGNGGKISVDDLFQKADSAACSHNLHLRAVFQKLFNTSRMIRLRMIHDQIIDFRHVYDLFQLVQIFIKEFFLGGLKQYGLSASFPYIGIIGRAELRVHDDVKHTKIVVHNTCPVESVSQFQCFHNRPSLSFCSVFLCVLPVPP